ncbi:homoserine dehydrogenase [Desulfatiglans anilini]|uniref:homoserine dehydrogenase n=1 Tax=Desulfatiglans anilini TaxID=90728 RepID=UPI0004203B6C|nr:homoserine dehydrogenase [Desulfatiglans anilini]
MPQLQVGIIGFGTVGAGACEVLLENGDLIADRVGMEIVIRRIADLDIERDRGVAIDRRILTRDAMEIIEDPEIGIVVEVMGGLKQAKEFIRMALERGKHVVTANKALLAETGNELFELAERNGVGLAFEASVGGGIPIIRALRSGLAANRIQTIMGILNGTSNYILTRMAREALPYEKVVEDAVREGYAEDPPTLDVDGTDAAHKLAILIMLSRGEAVPFDGIYREGIMRLTPDDLRFAGEFGYSVKLLAIARHHGDRVEARVHPAMIPKDHILANVNDVYNAIYIEGDFVGPNLYYGLGAGRRATGSAVVSDIMDLARQMRSGQGRVLPSRGYARPVQKHIAIQPMDELVSAYYFRFSAQDKPGVLSRIAGILGDHQISISSVIQMGREVNGSVPIVMLTHEARERSAQRAIGLIDRLDVLTDRTVMIRVEGAHT